MVVGSTLLVHPTAAIPGYATQNGSYLAIVNLSETPYDDSADVLLQGKAGQVLPEITKKIRQLPFS